MSLRVSCKVDRCWDIANQEFAGVYKNGEIVGFSTRDIEGDLVNVGIVCFDADNTFEAIPLEFIEKID